MKPVDLLARARAAQIALSVEGGMLRWEAPVGRMTPALKAELVAHKAALLALLEAGVEAYNERAAILEYDAGLPQPEAETRAFALVYCRDCRHFTADPINPAAGIGGCAAGWARHGRHGPMGTAPPYPSTPRYCTAWRDH